jgi:hypothetical protein
MMINEWNETGIMNVNQQQIDNYSQNLPAPIYQPKAQYTSPELL